MFDLVLIDMNDTLIRVGLAIFANIETRLLTLDLEQMQLCFKSLVMELRATDVISVALFIESKGSMNTLGKIMAVDIRNHKSSPSIGSSPWSRKAMESRWEPDSDSSESEEDGDSYNEYIVSSFQTDSSLADNQQKLHLAYDADNEDIPDTQKGKSDNPRKCLQSIAFKQRIRKRRDAKINVGSAKDPRRICCFAGEPASLWTPFGRRDDLRMPCRHQRARRGHKSIARVLRFDPKAKPDGYSRTVSCYCRNIEVHLNVPIDLERRHHWLPQLFSDWLAVDSDTKLPHDINIVFASYIRQLKTLNFLSKEEASEALYDDDDDHSPQIEICDDLFLDTCLGLDNLSSTTRFMISSKEVVNKKLRFGTNKNVKKKIPSRRPARFELLQDAAFVNRKPS